MSGWDRALPKFIELVIPAKAGIHFDFSVQAKIKMDPGFRRDDEPSCLHHSKC